MIKFRKTPEGPTTMTVEKEKILLENYMHIPVKTLARMIDKSPSGVVGRMKQLNLIIPEDIILKRKMDSRFNTGHVPGNKGKKQTEYMTPEQIEKTKWTWYKKGDIPGNKKEIGAISIRSYGRKNSNYKIQFIKTGNGNLEWQPLHIYNWLKAGNEIPKGFVLAFKASTMDADIENLELLSMEQNMLRNSIQNYPEELRDIMQLKGKLTKQINKNLGL